MKRSFTLLEMLIAISLFMFVYFVMTNILSDLELSKNFIKKKYEYTSKEEKTLKTLYGDILNATYIKIVKRNKNFTTIYLRTTNSLYNLSYPFVVWYVTNKNNLIRVESINQQLLPLKNTGYLYDFGHVKIFRIFQNKDKFFIFYEKKKPLYFELYKGIE